MPAFDSLTTRMPNGLTNAAPYQTMGAAGIPDPSWNHTYFNDFDTYTAADWTIADTGTITRSLANIDGGGLSIVTDTTSSDGTYMKLAQTSFKMSAGKQFFFKAQLDLSDVTNSSFSIGLFGAASLGVTPTDGIFIQKVSGGATLQLILIAAGVTISTLNLPSTCVITNNVLFELGIYIDKQGNVAAYFNPTTGDNTPIQAVNGPNYQRGYVAAVRNNGSTATSLLPSVTMSLGWMFQTGAAAAKTMVLDYILASKER